MAKQRESLAHLRYSIMSPDEDNKFVSMNPYMYYGGTTFMYGICLLLGLFVKDLGIVFDLMNSFTLSFLNFIWPGTFYLLAEHRYGDPHTRNDR